MRSDLINSQFPILNSHPKGRARCARLPRMRIENRELRIDQIREDRLSVK